MNQEKIQDGRFHYQQSLTAMEVRNTENNKNSTYDI